MGWIAGLVLSMAVMLAAVILAILLGVGKYRRGRFITPLHVLIGGLFLSILICMVPIYRESLSGESDSLLKTILFSLHNTFQVFTLDADRNLILEEILCPSEGLSAVYSAYVSTLFVVAPVMTFGFLISFFKNLSAYLKYLRYFFRDIHVFSELNEKSLALAADLKRNNKRARIVFTDVFETNDELSYELIERAMELRAICFKKDILAVNFKLHHRKRQIDFYTIGKNETENIEQALRLIEEFRGRNRTRLFVFSTNVESELLLNRADRGKMKVRRVNEVRSLVSHILYEEGHKLFEGALPCPDGTKQISAVIVGMGRHGTEMLKALAWFCQMDGYHVQIDAFDRKKQVGDRFAAQAPELMSEKYNGVHVPGEAEYTIRIHAGYDVTTQTFAEEIKLLKSATYVLVALGSDEKNIRTAVELRMLFERMGVHPVIQTIVYSTGELEALTGITNYRGQAYDIDFIGDIRSIYSYAVIINSELEKDALKRHLKWGKEEEFWQYEYNYRSSVATAIHMRARIACGIPGASKTEDELTPEERDVIEVLEHRRWNAYMRSEGYIYSGSHDKSSRNDLGKMHHDLVDFSSLSEEEKRKDSSVGTI